MEKTIQFVANFDDWVSIKKLKVEEKTQPKTIMEFLASLSMGIEGKVEENLGKTIDIKKLNEAINEIECGKSEQEIANALREVNTRKVSAIIKEITELPEFQKNEQKELNQFCKNYATKKVLKNCGLSIDYADINIPGSKRKKIKKE